MNLHADIMSLPITKNMAEIGLKGDMLLYKEGHRDARHAAAEIAIQAENRIEELEKALQDLIWAVISNSLSDVILAKNHARDILHKQSLQF